MTFYTPTYKRPTLLHECEASVWMQALPDGRPCKDWQHLVIPDEVGIGIAGMYAEIPQHLGRIDGEYVYVLQDDDRLAGPDVLSRLRTFARKHRNPLGNLPPVIMVRNRKRGMLLPLAWECKPVLGAVDLGSYLTRADVFKKHAGRFGKRYEGDFDFIAYLWRHYEFAWCDVLFAEAQTLGLGRSEADLRMQGELR